MSIPIKNIYYLLSYAWNKLEESELVDVSAEDESDLLNLLGRVFLNGTKTLLKRGIDRQYIAENEVYQGIKGKVNITDSLRKNLFSKGLSVCEFDELSADILPNQILKTTLQNLTQIQGLSPTLKQEIRTIIYRLHEVSEIVLTDTIFHQVQINRNNSFYVFLLNVSELIYQNLLINEETGSFQFKDFLRDERQMARLFEEFVRNFYKIEIPDAKVFINFYPKCKPIFPSESMSAN
jgi:5-methylcytosine-specific restriction enzyme subunit McrC